jgi:hypothetical protein
LQLSKELIYSKGEQVSLTENESLFLNISLEYTPVKLEGLAKYEGVGIKNIDINFVPSTDVENNTAEIIDPITTGEDGNYEINLIPGSYNVRVQQKEGQILVYSFEDFIELQIGEGRRDYNITLTRHSSNLSGFTKYNGINVPDITNILFTPDRSVDNNSAIYTVSTESDAAGVYTVELSPGYYNVTVNHPFTENDQNYSYVYSSKIEISEEPMFLISDIELIRIET